MQCPIYVIIGALWSVVTIAVIQQTTNICLKILKLMESRSDWHFTLHSQSIEPICFNILIGEGKNTIKVLINCHLVYYYM